MEGWISKSDSDYVYRYQANPGLSAEIKKNNRNAQNGLNGTDYLYERIPGAIREVTIYKKDDEGESYTVKGGFQIFKRINIKGLFGIHNSELHLEPFQQSIHEQNQPFDELKPIIQKEIEALQNYIWKSSEKDVSLQSSVRNESINSEEPIDNLDTNMNEDSIQKEGKDNLSTNMSSVERTSHIITRDEVKSNPKTLYLFGDNLLQRGLGGQAKEMRGETNTVGVPTKRAPNMKDAAFMSDKDLEANQKAISDAIEHVMMKWNSKDYNKLVIPPMGVGLAELPTRAPKTWEFLQSELKRLEDYVNSKQNLSSGKTQLSLDFPVNVDNVDKIIKDKLDDGTLTEPCKPK